MKSTLFVCFFPSHHNPPAVTRPDHHRHQYHSHIWCAIMPSSTLVINNSNDIFYSNISHQSHLHSKLTQFFPEKTPTTYSFQQNLTQPIPSNEISISPPSTPPPPLILCLSIHSLSFYPVHTLFGILPIAFDIKSQSKQNTHPYCNNNNSNNKNNIFPSF